MRIDKITITGADDKADMRCMLDTAQLFPFAEWGILFSKSKEGSPRYPSRDKVKEFAAMGIPLSAHFCGWYSSQIMEEFNFRLFDEFPAFSRFQINYNFSKSDRWKVKWILDWAADHPTKSVIFQVNGANQRAIGMIEHNMRSKNIHFLYDSSGGRGSQTASILPPFRNYTGYSGGLNPDNVKEFAYKVSERTNPAIVWLDMESGVRTENEFDLDKVHDVLEATSALIVPEPVSD